MTTVALTVCPAITGIATWVPVKKWVWTAGLVAKQSLGAVVAGEIAVPGAKGAFNGQGVWAVYTKLIVVDVSA